MSDRVILTTEEHSDFVHLCGRTGKEVDEMGGVCEPNCPFLKDCLMSHCIKPGDLLSDEEYEFAVDRLVEFFRERRNRGGV